MRWRYRFWRQIQILWSLLRIFVVGGAFSGTTGGGLGAAFSGTTGEGKNFPAGFKMDRGAAGCREELLAVDMGGSAAGCRVVRDASVNEKIPCLPAMLHNKFTIFFLSITLLSSWC